jgi:hypothetical protein
MLINYDWAVTYYFEQSCTLVLVVILRSLCYETKDNRPLPKVVPISQVIKTLNVFHSYNIYSNLKYKNIILNLERHVMHHHIKLH